ncbi:MAG: hypothetical protein ACM3ML_00520 [Micromonosporaceae bacterium]
MVTAGIAAVAVAGAAVTAVLAGPAHISLSANASHAHHTSHHGNGFRGAPIAWQHLQFSTLDNATDPTFNQLLSINNRGVIAGYFGSGAAGHPNKAYLLNIGRPGTPFINVNFPGSVQTQVTGINDRGVTVGFFSPTNNANEMNANFGFYSWGGRFHTVNFPTAFNSTPPVNQLLGVNNLGVAVGFYNDARGNAHGYTFNIFTHRFRTIRIWGAKSVTAAGINDRGDIVGFFTDRRGITKSFLLLGGHHLITFAFRGATMTQALGVNNGGEVVGAYTIGKAENAKTHGFTWRLRGGWLFVSSRHWSNGGWSWNRGWKWGSGFMTVDNPNGIGATTINGLNANGQLVGFYTDAKGNTHGFIVARNRFTAPPVMTPTATPTMTATPTATPTMTGTAAPTATPTPTTPSGVPTAPSGQPTHF